MDLQRFCIKLFARPAPDFDEESLIPVFHEWIRTGAPLGTLIDVADYRHVPQGPGVMLIAHEGNFAVDHAEGGRMGLLYQRKLAHPAEALHLRIMAAAAQAVGAARMLAQEPRMKERLDFDAAVLRFIANDRLLAPNTDAARAAVAPELQRAAEHLFDGGFDLRPASSSDPRDRLSVDLIARGAPTLQALYDRLSAAA